MNQERKRKGRQLPGRIISIVPIGLCQPFLRRIVHNIARKHPGIFRRLGPHCVKSFLIQPTNLPFVLLLQPDPRNPRMTAHRSARGLVYQSSISGSFLKLFYLLDGRGDGDAIFFSRDLKIEGDTEAVVSLRNALDDVEGSIAEDIAELYRPFGNMGLFILRRLGN